MQVSTDCICIFLRGRVEASCERAGEGGGTEKIASQAGPSIDRMVQVWAHPSVVELGQRSVTCAEPVEARHTQAAESLAQGRTVGPASQVPAFGERWIRRLLERDNAAGPDAPGIGRRRNGSMPRILVPGVRDKLPRSRQRGGPGHAPLRHRGPGLAPRRGRNGGRPRRARRAAPRPRRMAHHQETRLAGQHHPDAAACPLARTQPGRSCDRLRRRTSGSSCATTGSATASSRPAPTSSTIAAAPGTGSSISPGA